MSGTTSGSFPSFFFLSDFYGISTQYIITNLFQKVPYVGKPEPMVLMNCISIKIGLEIICTVIESPDRHCHMITSLSRVGYTIETRPVLN